MNAAEKRALVERYIDAYNRMDVDGMLATLHRDVSFANVAGGETNARTQGIDEFAALARQSLPLFSERRQTVESFDAAGDRAVASIAFRAVVANDLPNGLKAGQALDFRGRSEFEFRDGAIAAITDIS